MAFKNKSANFKRLFDLQSFVPILSLSVLTISKKIYKSALGPKMVRASKMFKDVMLIPTIRALGIAKSLRYPKSCFGSVFTFNSNCVGL